MEPKGTLPCHKGPQITDQMNWVHIFQLDSSKINFNKFSHPYPRFLISFMHATCSVNLKVLPKMSETVLCPYKTKDKITMFFSSYFYKADRKTNHSRPNGIENVLNFLVNEILICCHPIYYQAFWWWDMNIHYFLLAFTSKLHGLFINGGRNTVRFCMQSYLRIFWKTNDLKHKLERENERKKRLI